MDVFVCEVLRCPYINLIVDTMYMYVRTYVWTHAIATQGHYSYRHHTGRAIWHEQQQQHSMSMSCPQ